MSQQPKYAHLAHQLARRLRAGQWGHDTPLPSNLALGREYGVSLATVRSALTMLDDQGLLTRVPGRGIFAKAGSAGSAPAAPGENPFGRCRLPAEGEWAGLTLGIVSHHWRRDEQHAHTSFERLLRGAEYAVAHGGGQTRLLQTDHRHPHRATAWLPLLEQENVHAVLALGEWWRPHEEFAAIVGALQRRRVPVVQVYGDYYPPVATHTVVIDGTAGIGQAVAHLRELGHQHLGFIGFDNDMVWGQDRRRAFLAASGADEQQVVMVPMVRPAAAGAAAALLALAGRCTAIVAANDWLANLVVSTLTAHGARVPTDLSVTGFDDNTEFRADELTTVGLPLEEVAVVAINLLHRGLSEDLAGALHYIQLVPRLLRRRSTAPPRANGLTLSPPAAASAAR